MTQEEHLECSHQINSNPVDDQVNDDSEKSKNIAASNQANAVKSNITNSRGIESVDEAHVLDDKDRVRGSGRLDLKVFNEDRSVVRKSEVKISDKNNNNLEMTVITHQGSGENIREIQTKIENSEKILNNNSSDAVGGVGDRIENGEFKKPTESVNTSENDEKKEIKLSSKISDNSEKSKITNTTSQSDSKENDEDPFARLKALRANISNALREVKAVLSEHGGEATNEQKEENEEIKPPEDNAIRFRFVRRIRKKSSFDEASANKFQSDNTKESTDGEIKDILEIDKESLLTTNNLVQRKLEHVEESLSILEPDQVKQADPSANAIKKDKSTHLLAVQDEIVDTLPSNTKNTVIGNKQIPESQDTAIPSDYRIKIIESQGITEEVQQTIATEGTKLEDNKILTKDKLIASKNTSTPENKNEPLYRVNVVESVAEENEKLAASTLVENKEKVSTGDKNEKEMNEPHYIVKVVEVESGSMPIESENSTPKKTDSKKSSIKDARVNAEKPQGKVKTKLVSNQTKPVKPKVGAKSNSEKNEASDEKPKNRKTKSEVEVGKKSKRSSKEISKTEVLSVEKSKTSSSTIKSTKSKSKKESVTPSEKTEKISQQDKMPLVSVPSKDIASAIPKTISLVPVNDLVSVSSKTEINLKSEKLESTSTKNIDPVPVPQKSVFSMESTKEAPITTNEQIPIENKKVQDQILSNQAPGKHKADKPVQIEEKKVPILKEEKEPLAGQQNISTNDKVSPIQVKSMSISKQSQESIESSKTTDIKLIELSQSILPKTLPNTGKREETLSDHENVTAGTGSPTKNKTGPTSALEKVLATTNFKLLREDRPSLPCEKPSTTELVNVPIKSSPSDMSRISSSRTEMEKHQTEIQDLSSTTSASNDAGKLTTTTTKTLTSLSTNEKITSKSDTNKTSNQHTNVTEEKINHDVNTNKNLDSPQADENLKLERKPVDKSKLSLKIESNKIGTVASRLTLTQLQSPTKAVQLVSSKLDVVPVSKPSQILIKDINLKEDRALIISQSNESQPICDENITHEDNQIISTKLEEKSEEVIKEQQENSTGEKKSPEEEKIHKEKGNTTKKRKMKKKVVIRRLKRRLSTDGTVPGRQDSIESAEPEICEKEIKLNDPEPIVEPEPIPEEEKLPPGPKSCIKKREFQPGDIVLYNDRIKKIAKWKKATVIERITSISYKLDVEGEEKSCHICYIKKFTDKKVQFGAKEYLEIDYAEDEDEEEEEYNIWARV